MGGVIFHIKEEETTMFPHRARKISKSGRARSSDLIGAVVISACMMKLARIEAAEAARASLAIPEHVMEQLAAASLHQTLWV